MPPADGASPRLATASGSDDRPLAGLRVLLGVSGGIAAYKAPLLARLLLRAGAQVDPVLTRGALEFVGAATFEGLTGRPARSEVWEDIPGETHVALGRAADLAIVYPATAHTLARLAHGLADDLLTTTLLAATCPLVVAPAMHTEMWQHAATQANVEVLRSRGVHVLGPVDGPLMGGDSGPGRVVEPVDALDALRALASGGTTSTGRGDRNLGVIDGARADDARPGDGADPADAGHHDVDARHDADLRGRRILVTAGGTREPIDPVRFLGNRSSGRMGFALAAAAVRRGASVELVAAPTDLATPDGVRRTDVTTALEMRDAVLARADEVDVIIKAAAVADFRPEQAADSKLKKDGGPPELRLIANPDILAELGAARAASSASAHRPLLVGFAAETDDPEAHGREKLARKGADLLVVNDVSAPGAGFEVGTNEVVILGRDGGRIPVPLASKAEVADRILDAIVARLG